MKQKKRRQMHNSQSDQKKVIPDTWKAKHKDERREMKPESLNHNAKCQEENDYYDMKPLPVTGEYCMSTCQDYNGGEDIASMISYDSCIPTSYSGSDSTSTTPSLGELGNILESLLASDNITDTVDSLLALSSSKENCQKIRKSGCLSFLINQLHTHPTYQEINRPSQNIRRKVLNILTNIAQNQNSDRQIRRDLKVLDLLWNIKQYSDLLRDILNVCKSNETFSAQVQETGCKKVQITLLQEGKNLQDFIVCGKITFLVNMFNHFTSDFGILQQKRKLRIPAKHFLTIDFNHQLSIDIADSVSILTRCSFDERYREPIIRYGGIQSLAELVKVGCF